MADTYLLSEVTVDIKEVKRRLVESNQLAKYVNKNTANPDDAAEFYQEAIVRVIEQAKHNAIQNPVAYAIRVAKNLIINTPKNDFLNEIDDIACQRSNPESELSGRQEYEHLLQIIEAMPPLRKKVFILRRLEGKTRKVIARELDLSLEAVSKHLTRAMAEVQQALDRNTMSRNHDE